MPPSLWLPPLHHPHFPSPPSIMAAGVIAAAWGWQRELPSISLTTNSHEDGWRCSPQLISIYKGVGWGPGVGGVEVVEEKEGKNGREENN